MLLSRFIVVVFVQLILVNDAFISSGRSPAVVRASEYLFEHCWSTKLCAKRRIKATVKRRSGITESSVDEVDNRDESLEDDAGLNQELNLIKSLANGETSSLSEESIQELLRKDIASFALNPELKKDNPLIATIKNAFAVFLIADFFVVIVFLLWFLIAAASQKSNPYLLERFQDIFQPVVVPSLTVLMVGSFLSGDVMKGEKKAI
jgi:hypothetical protein